MYTLPPLSLRSKHRSKQKSSVIWTVSSVLWRERGHINNINNLEMNTSTLRYRSTEAYMKLITWRMAFPFISTEGQIWLHIPLDTQVSIYGSPIYTKDTKLPRGHWCTNGSLESTQPGNVTGIVPESSSQHSMEPKVAGRDWKL